jgi:CheY-like chemotaxis protein
MAKAMAEAREMGSNRRGPGDAAAAQGAGRVLVIEDEQDVAELIRYNLAKEGYDVRVVRNGVDGLKQAKESRPDMILLDIMVPQLMAGRSAGGSSRTRTPGAFR